MSEQLKHTALYDLHVSREARMVPFAGYAMPLHYGAGIMAEHLHTRASAGLFDVSHMGQVRLHGADAAVKLETLVPGDIVGLKPGRQRYTVLTNERGGVRDDLMVSHAGDHLLAVVNAACKRDDLAHLQKVLGLDALLDEERALLALQGPRAAEVLVKHAPDVADMRFMDARSCRIDGKPAFVTRSGYTGEDGFELSLEQADALGVAELLLNDEAVLPVGLGARDSLRLEAGLCLYGQDLDATTTPIEADIAFAVGKARRPGGSRAGGYPGAEVISAQILEGVSRKRVGLQPRGRAPVRAGARLHDGDGVELGVVTSGVFGPSVGGPVAMGYVSAEAAKLGAEIFADVRGKALPVRIGPPAAISTNYAR